RKNIILIFTAIFHQPLCTHTVCVDRHYLSPFTMALVKLGHEDTIKDGERIVKVCWERCVVAIRHGDGLFHCFELPDSSFAQADAEKLRVVPGCKSLQTYRDIDGALW
ncbi:hypothetical protein COO60DRAFT_492023, partial [Scenedesmus sp. NREL 46B-D3]